VILAGFRHRLPAVLGSRWWRCSACSDVRLVSPNEQAIRLRVLTRFPSDGADEFDLDLRGVLLGVPFPDVDQSGLDEIEAFEELGSVADCVIFSRLCPMAAGPPRS
jgi:hypothetical protein